VICGWVVKAAPRWVPTDARVIATFVAAPTALVTVTVYVAVVVPSWAVTTTVIVFAPTFKEMDPDADPDVTAVPLTVIVALA
jgi:hypothetical protein